MRLIRGVDRPYKIILGHVVFRFSPLFQVGSSYKKYFGAFHIILKSGISCKKTLVTNHIIFGRAYHIIIPH